MAVLSSPKEMGSNTGCGDCFGQSTARCLGTVLDSPKLKLKGLFLDNPGLNMGTIFGQSEIGISGLLWAISGLILD